MVDINLNIAHPEKNESANEVLEDEEAESLFDYKLGEEVDGETLGLDGGVFEITGGSDRAGFPMRKDTPGIGRHKVLIKSGTGLRQNREETAQVNLKVVDEGSGLFEEDETGEDDAGDESDESEA